MVYDMQYLSGGESGGSWYPLAIESVVVVLEGARS